jgi:hypothetical protein
MDMGKITTSMLTQGSDEEQTDIGGAINKVMESR